MTGTPFFPELLQLAAAAACGVFILQVQAWGQRQKHPFASSLAQAQILLCVAAALLVSVIADSLARAFSIAGAAAIIRFRTPVENPRDTILLLILLALGMSCGLGHYGLALPAALFVAVTLLAFDRLRPPQLKHWILEVTTTGGAIAAGHIEAVLRHHGATFEPRLVNRGEESVFKYQVSLDASASLQNLNHALLVAQESQIRAVAWAPPKRSET